VNFKRIHIIGGPGSGTTYVASLISARTGIPMYSLDDVLWDPRCPGYRRVEDGECSEKLLTIVRQDAWIVEGSYYKWVAPSFQRAGITIFLKTGAWRRGGRLIRRFIRRKLGLEEDRRKDSIINLLSALKINRVYDREHLPGVREILSRLGKEAVECESWEDIREVLDIPG
jgi:adenylate kinase family enzyme